ncbi:unnamed protein product, partial [marine sediment metagenome]
MMSYTRIVVKFGTSLLTAGTDHLELSVMANLAQQIAQLHRQGREIVIVSSGAIAAGRQEMGYEMEDTVEVPGTIARRGGIIDIFPVCSQSPARIEFLGNQIESMRLFNTESQCSTSPISSLTITPAREAVISRAKQITSALNLDSCTSEVKQRLEEDVAKLQQRQWFTGAEFYFPLFNDGNILDYLCDNAFIILNSPDEIKT